jgi:hypothetical protein
MPISVFSITLPQVLSILRTPYEFVITFRSYLVLVRFLRHRRSNCMQKKYAKFTKDPYSMPYQAAHEISRLHMLDEQLFLHAFATQWAVIKTCAIASGTNL